MYPFFTCEVLHNLNHISKMMECVFRSILPRGVGTGRRRAVLQVCNLLVSAIQRSIETLVLTVDFANGGRVSDLNGLCTNNRILGMFEGKDIEALDMMFPFLGAFVRKGTG